MHVTELAAAAGLLLIAALLADGGADLLTVSHSGSGQLGIHAEAGQVLGTVIDALEGAARETVKAPCAGLVFSQRSYSSVYPGTLIARIRKERA